MNTRVYYHGTSNDLITNELLPPDITGCLQERGRKKNLNRVFFTLSHKSAAVYAGRAANVYGGNKRVLQVIPIGDIICINDTPGCEVYCSDSAIVINSTPIQ